MEKGRRSGGTCKSQNSNFGVRRKERKIIKHSIRKAKNMKMMICEEVCAFYVVANVGGFLSCLFETLSFFHFRTYLLFFFF